MMVKITGQILKAFPAQSGVSQSSGNQWMSQDFVLQHDFDPQHPKYLSFRVFGQQRIQQLNLQEGQMVILSLDVNAREYNGKWYNEISAFKVEYPQMQGMMPQQQMQGGMQMPPMQGGMPPMQAPQQQMPPQGAMPPQQQGCQTYYQNGTNQMPYNVPQAAPQQQMPPQQMAAQAPMPPHQAMPQQAPFPPQS